MKFGLITSGQGQAFLGFKLTIQETEVKLAQICKISNETLSKVKQ